MRWYERENRMIKCVFESELSDARRVGRLHKKSIDSVGYIVKLAEEIVDDRSVLGVPPRATYLCSDVD